MRDLYRVCPYLIVNSRALRVRRILVIMDWGAAYNMGRPTSIHDEEYVLS